MKICNFCGRENLDAARFCASCGNNFCEDGKEEAPAEAVSAEPAEQTVPDTENGAAVNTETEQNAGEGDGETTAEDKQNSAAGVNFEGERLWFGESEPPAVTDENAFYETVVPTRLKDNIKSLSIYLWLCAGLNAFIAIIMWDFLSLTIAVMDAVLAVFIRKRKKWAAILGIVYSAVGGVVFTVSSVLFGEGVGSTRVLLGWICSLCLFVSALSSLKAINKAWVNYRESGKDPWDTPAERELETRFAKNRKRNNIIVWSVFGACMGVFIAVTVVGVVQENQRYAGLDGGAWEENVYTNDYFDFSYTLPEDWTRLSDEELTQENILYYGGSNIKRNGGTLVEAYDMPTFDEAWVAMYVSVIRQDGDEWTGEEILSDWVLDNESYAEEYCDEYTAGEIDSVTIAGKEFASVKETFVYSDESANLYEESVYTYVYQDGRYTLSIEFWIYDPAMTDAEVEALLGGFTPVK